MQNPYLDVMPDAVNSWKRALSGSGRLPDQALVFRYVTRHRDSPEEMGKFFADAVDRGDMKREHVESEMESYVKRMEGLVKKEMR